MNQVAYNINDTVWIKLTDKGRQIHRAIHEKYKNPFPYEPPKVDADGWHQTQLWCVMADYGHAVSMGFDLPFETTIRLDGDFMGQTTMVARKTHKDF